MSDPQIPNLPPIPELPPTPVARPQSTTAQKVTAAAVTPVGIIAMLILLPFIGCFALDVLGQFVHIFGGGR